MTSISETLAAALEYFRDGHLKEAQASCRDVLQSQPHHDSVWRLLGVISTRLGNNEDAVDSLKRSLAISPLNAECHNNLGEAYRLMGRLEDAVHSFKTALEIDTNSVEAWNNLGIALAELCRPKAAAAGFRRAIAIRPESAEAHCNLGLALLYQGKLSEAINALRQALSLNPDYANAWHNLAVALKDQGCLEEANVAFEHALEIDPDNPAARSAYLITLHYAPHISAERLLQESLDWSQRHAEKVIATPARSHDHDPAKRLRIGYVSGDFRSHPVGYLLQPVLSLHNRSEVEIFCYANHVIYDEQSERLHQAADHWRTVVGFSDEKLAQSIRDDAVDILVDLSGHTDRNRLSVFARKPAPVQVTWLGYFSSTGLNTIDYLIADGTLIPPMKKNTTSNG
jgi:protein O-GlcNAc transferase